MTAIVELPPLLDTPAHVHANEDELFIAIEGEHVITRGEEEITIGPGEAVFAPRARPALAAARGRGRGPDHGRLHARGAWRASSASSREAEAEGRLGPEAYAAASEHYGITWL